MKIISIGYIYIFNMSFPFSLLGLYIHVNNGVARGRGIPLPPPKSRPGCKSWFLSHEGPMLETLDYTIRIGSTPTFLYFDL